MWSTWMVEGATVDCIICDFGNSKSLFGLFLWRWVQEAWWMRCVAEAGVPIWVAIVISIIAIVIAVFLIIVCCRHVKAKKRVKDNLQPGLNKVKQNLESIIWQSSVEKPKSALKRHVVLRYVGLFSPLHYSCLSSGPFLKHLLP